MELLSTDQYFILLDGEHSLWINRHTQSISAKTGADYHGVTNATCLGKVYGYLGKINFGTGFDTRLVFIRQKALVGVLDGCEIFKILSVVSVPLETDIELILESCEKHIPAAGDSIVNSPIIGEENWNIHPPTSLEHTGQRNLFKVKTSQAVPSCIERVSPLLRRSDRMDKVERKIVEEFHKMFTDADSFYYSLKYDLTNTVQRQYFISEKKEEIISSLHSADSRFIWNYHMLSDLFQSEEPGVQHWIIPIVHGFIEHCKCNLDIDDGLPGGVEKRDFIDLWLISRRSRFRAGTRYLRRGVDEDGKVANYVETEQIMIFQQHKTSFVQVRGSIPLFWSQSGQRYRPIPRLDRSEGDTFTAFQKHFNEEISTYGPVLIVNLVDKTGKEKVLGDAFLSNVLTYNSANVTYLSFDFHDHCRGMHFENVAVVINKLEDAFNVMSYSWVDSYGIVLKQKGVIRVNCVDCLDRTNLTQTQFGRHVLETQLSKLRLLAPEIGLAKSIRTKLQTMWANNGDTISKQYAGTNALKGDYTRTGERKISGALKDGMNSANRYYLNRFRDAHRQAAIDLTMGERKTISEDDLDDAKGVGGEEKEATIEQVKTVIEDVKKCFVPKQAVILGAWGFVNARKNAPTEVDIDAIFILTEDCCFVAEYDCTLDSITETETINLLQLTAMELGYEKTTLPSNFFSFLSNTISHSSSGLVPCLRISYSRDGEGHCHEFLSSNIQFFNNVAMHLQQPEEMLEALRLVADSIQVAATNVNNPVKFQQTKFLADHDDSKPVTPLTPSSPSVGFGHLKSDSVDLEKVTKVKRDDDKSRNPDLQGSSEDTCLNKEASQLTRVGSIKHTKQLEETDCNPCIPPANKTSKGDFVLASCGVISYGSDQQRESCERSKEGLSQMLSPCAAMPSVKSNFELPSVVKASTMSTPVQMSVELPNDESPEEPMSVNLAVGFRHRLSLPACSIQPDIPIRSTTPEITVTEVPQNALAQCGDTHNSKLGIPALTKRISRSTEEIAGELNTVEHDDGSGIVSQKLSPTLSKDNRSSSIQNLFNSALNMKSSRSENTILSRTNSARTATANPISKESVLVPLGRLARGMQKGANYFDPRKLKDTFKPAARNLHEEVQRKEDREYSIALEEKKRKCKSVIIEI